MYPYLVFCGNYNLANCYLGHLTDFKAAYQLTWRLSITWTTLKYLPVSQNAGSLPKNYQMEMLPSIDFSLYPTWGSYWGLPVPINMNKMCEKKVNETDHTPVRIQVKRSEKTLVSSKICLLGKFYTEIFPRINIPIISSQRPPLKEFISLSLFFFFLTELNVFILVKKHSCIWTSFIWTMNYKIA